MKSILSETTSAVASSPFVATNNPVLINLDSSTAAPTADEFGTVQYRDSIGTWRNAYNESGDLIQLDVNRPQVLIVAPGNYRVNKAATTETVGYSIQTQERHFNT